MALDPGASNFFGETGRRRESFLCLIVVTFPGSGEKQECSLKVVKRRGISQSRPGPSGFL
jgi:hypothetical protein